jgi:nucleolar protein 56
LAGKALIAAKVDFYKGEFIGEKLKADMDKRIEEIKQKYPEAPKKQPQKPQARRSNYKARYKK